MSLRIIFWAALLGSCTPAYADNTCSDAVTRAKETMTTALNRKPDRYSGKFNQQEFTWVVSRTIPVFSAAAPTDEWITRSGLSTLEINAGRFCSLAPKDQARWIFHGYLVALGTESDRDTHVSSTFKTFDELTAWFCDLSLYLLSSSSYDGSINSSAVTHPTRATGYGEEPADAWNEALKSTSAGTDSDYVPCYQVGYRPGSYGSQEPFCAVRSNFGNSCQRMGPEVRR